VTIEALVQILVVGGLIMETVNLTIVLAATALKFDRAIVAGLFPSKPEFSNKHVTAVPVIGVKPDLITQ
jgi:hypothetical protein